MWKRYATVLCLVCVSVAGCGNSRQGGFARDVVVQFNLPAGNFTPPADEVTAVRRNCPGGPDAVPEPLPPADALPSVRLNGVRYDVAGADDETIGALQACILRQPGVKTAQLEDEDS